MLWRQQHFKVKPHALPQFAARVKDAQCIATENSTGASVWKRFARCSKGLGHGINGASLLYPIFCISASNGTSSLQIEARVSVRALGLLDHLIERI